MPDATPYVPLWTKSNYSFLEGASHPGELVDQARAVGLPALALTDRDGVYGIVRAHVRAKERGLRMIYGSEITVGPDPDEPLRDEDDPWGRRGSVVLLAQNRQGYAELCRLISKGRLRSTKGVSRVRLEEVCEAGTNLLALCAEPAFLPPLEAAFGDRIYALCVRHRAFEDVPSEQMLREAAARLNVPLVAAVEVLYHLPERRPLQDILTCIRHRTTLATAQRSIRGNAEHHLKSPEAMRALFADDLEILHRTVEIAQRCNFALEEISYRYPAERIPGDKTQSDWLREQTFAGAVRRYGRHIPDDVRAQLERELALIAELDYGGYFLTMREIVEFCRSRGIACQGRGSAANSAVCYCLGITAIDPVRMDLLFERFLSKERAEPPDIDLDIEHERREEVIAWVYERYGRRHAAMVANVIRYRPRSAVRDVGKALGLPATALERLAKQLGLYESRLEADILAHAGLDPALPVHQHLLNLSSDLLDFPRHLSIHPGGFLLGHEPVDTIVPIEPGTMEGRTVIQWDKYEIEELGLFKVDLLGLGALTLVRNTFALLEQHEGIALEMATVPAEDPVTYAMISRGDTVGVFQIESRAQMAMLPRMQPRTFYDLVIEVAIVRPGPIQGDMVHPYLRRRCGQEVVDFPHKSLKRVLGKTLGVPIFQEQVMKLAMLVADYSPGEADQLRRDMAAWRSAGRIERHRERLIERMKRHGITEAFAQRVFAQIQGFGEYGFPESHAASFALIAYVTAWLRCHHLAAFTCALLNAQPMGFYSPATIIHDAQRHGIEVRPIDVTASAWDCTLEQRENTDEQRENTDEQRENTDEQRENTDEQRENADERRDDAELAIRMGYRYVKGFGVPERQRIEQARERGPFRSLEDFVRRVRLSKRALQALAESGGFACFGLDRRAAIWSLRGAAAKLDDGLELPGDIAPPDTQPRFVPVTSGEAILWDYRTSLHSARGHPLECVRDELQRRKLPLAEQVVRMRDGRRVDYVGLVICRQRPGTASGVTFFTLEDESGFVNVVVWRQVFDAHRILAKTALLLGVSGRLQVQGNVVHLVAATLWDPEVRIDPKGAHSRDFH